MSLQPPLMVGKLQGVLRAKAKESPQYRFYALYDKVPTLCYGPTGRGIHGVDECVSLSSVQRITGAMALFTAEWCGVEAVRGGGAST